MKFVHFLTLFIALTSVVISIKMRTTKDDELAQDDKLISKNNKYFAVMQGDGNFVVYTSGAFNGNGKISQFGQQTPTDTEKDLTALCFKKMPIW